MIDFRCVIHEYNNIIDTIDKALTIINISEGEINQLNLYVKFFKELYDHNYNNKYNYLFIKTNRAIKKLKTIDYKTLEDSLRYGIDKYLYKLYDKYLESLYINNSANRNKISDTIEEIKEIIPYEYCPNKLQSGKFIFLCYVDFFNNIQSIIINDYSISHQYMKIKEFFLNNINGKILNGNLKEYEKFSKYTLKIINIYIMDILNNIDIFFQEYLHRIMEYNNAIDNTKNIHSNFNYYFYDNHYRSFLKECQTYDSLFLFSKKFIDYYIKFYNSLGKYDKSNDFNLEQKSKECYKNIIHQYNNYISTISTQILYCKLNNTIYNN